jgi:cytochrome P450
MQTNFMIAGRDTTAIALTWAWMLIATHPAVEARLLAEATALLGPQQTGSGSSGGGAPPSYTSVDYDAVAHGLPFTQAVFMETLRLFPSVPKDVKQAVAHDVLPDGTRVQPGDVIAWSPFATGHSRAVWGPDAGEFKPERWLTPDGAGVIKPSAFKFPSFNAGPRTCLGQQMATVEGAYVIALVVHRYRVRLAPDVDAAVTAWLRDTAGAAGGGSSGPGGARIPATPLPYLESLTLPLRDGLRCVVTKR